MSATLQALSECGPFSKLSPAALAALSGVVRKVEFSPGARLIPLGQPPQRLFVITRGLAKLAAVTGDGRERILSVSQPGDVVGAGILLDNPFSDYEAAAMDTVEALAVSRRDLLSVGSSHAEIILALAREVAREIARMTERVMIATSAEVPVRLSMLLLEFASQSAGSVADFVPLSHRLTHEQMAQIVGASRPHTSTVLRRLEERGAVRRGNGRGGLMVRPLGLREIVANGDHAAVPTFLAAR